MTLDHKQKTRGRFDLDSEYTTDHDPAEQLTTPLAHNFSKIKNVTDETIQNYPELEWKNQSELFE